MLQDLLDALQETSLHPYLDRLRKRLHADDELRAVVADVGRLLVVLSQEPVSSENQLVDASSSATTPTEVPTRKTEEDRSKPALAPPREAPVPWPPNLHFAYATEPPPARSTEPSNEWPTDEELPLIAERSRLKAHASTWAARRRQQPAPSGPSGGDFEQWRLDLIAEAKEMPKCLLWMCLPSFTVEEPEWCEQLAGCYDASAAAAELLAEMLAEPTAPTALPELFHLTAEAQSALKVAVEWVNPGRPDWDQRRLYHWLRTTVSERHVWIGRHMRDDDPADPALWRDLQHRLDGLRDAFHHSKGRERNRRKGFNKLRFLLRRQREEPGEADRLWRDAIQTASELVQDGLPPSNPELRDVLVEHLDDRPEDVEPTREFQMVLREIERFRQSRPTPTGAPEAAAATDDVRRAAEMLRGRSAVLIGGVKRPDAAEALVKSLDLKELVWLEGSHKSHFDFEPIVARPDVAVVLLAIRWSSHGFGEVKDFCDQYGKLLVRLPTGYNPNQVAYQILHQVGGRLEPSLRPSSTAST